MVCGGQGLGISPLPADKSGLPFTTRRCRRVAFLHPHTPLTLKCHRPKPYAERPKTLDEHLLKRRLTLGLTQPQTATGLAIKADTLLLWKKDRVQPEARYFPAILRVLGFDPFPAPEKAVVIGTTDKVIRELRGHRNPEFLTADARHVLARIIRANNRDRKAVLAGETKAMAVWISEIWFGYADVK